MSTASPSKLGKAAPGLHVVHVVEREILDRFGRMIRQIFLGLFAADVRVTLITDDQREGVGGIPAHIGREVVARLSGWGAARPPAILAKDADNPPKLLHLWGTRALRTARGWCEQAGIPLLAHAVSSRDVHVLSQRGAGPQRHVAGLCRRFATQLSECGQSSLYPIQHFGPALIVPEDETERGGDTRTLGVVWIGRMTPNSGVETLLDAVKMLRENERHVQVALIGRGRAERSLRSAIRARELRDRVSIISDSGLWDSVMSGADVCIVPARQNSPSLAPLLAMAMRKTVIASSNQTAEWFLEDRTAWLFSPGSVTELARLLERTQTDAQAVAALGARARAYVQEQHSVTKLAESLRAFYAAVAFPQQIVKFPRPAGAAAEAGA